MSCTQTTFPVTFRLQSAHLYQRQSTKCTKLLVVHRLKTLLPSRKVTGD